MVKIIILFSYLLFGRSNESRIPVDVDGWSIEAELSGLIEWKE